MTQPLWTPPAAGEAHRKPVIVRASDIIPCDAEWLWEGRIPIGEITLLAGRGGVGKSTIFAWKIAKITKGTMRGRWYGTPRSILYVANEDSYNKTVVPRLMAAGADLSRVFLLRIENVLTGKIGSLNLPLDCEVLKEAVESVDACAVFLDPLSSNLKGVKNRNDQVQVREALEQIRQFAEDMNIAIPALVHLRKQASSNIMDAVSGSSELGNVARAVMGVASDPDPEHEGTFVLSQEKNNLGRTNIPSYRYAITSCPITYYSTGDELKPVGKVKILGETTTTASDILEDLMLGGRSGEAAEWLLEHLHQGPAAAADITKAAMKDGISRATLYRAADRLKIRKQKDAFQGVSSWSLPDGYVKRMQS